MAFKSVYLIAIGFSCEGWIGVFQTYKQRACSGRPQHGAVTGADAGGDAVGNAGNQPSFLVRDNRGLAGPVRKSSN